MFQECRLSWVPSPTRNQECTFSPVNEASGKVKIRAFVSAAENVTWPHS